MTSGSSYQPFLIGEGQSKTGLFQYLESWVKPADAFDTLEDAYVFRGSVYKRKGMSLYPSQGAPGALVYQNNEIGATGNGSTGPYSGILQNFPPIGTVTISAETNAGFLSSTASGTGNWSLGLAASGTIDFTTGVWNITTSSPVKNNASIVINYNFYPTQVTSNAGCFLTNAIMGIKTFINETTNAQVLVILDTRRANFYDPTVPVFKPINTISEDLGVGDGTSNPQTFNPGWKKIAPYSVVISDTASSINDASTGDGNLSTSATMVGPNTIDYATGAISLTLAAPNKNTYTWTATLQGDYFTGNNTNFFNATNWKPTDTAPALLYLTNNVDRVTVFDGTNLARPPFVTKFADLATLTNDIKTTLDVKVYKNSLLFLRPTIVGSSTPEAQMIRSSIPATSPNFSINNFVSDVSGNGAATPAPTGDWIMSAQFLRDIITVFFLNSTWVFRFTGSAFDPFRFDQVNSSKSTQAPYGSIAYDLQCTSMGNKGLIFCDGVNVDRYDINIIDQYLVIEPTAFGQCFGQRFDILQQSWMLYPDVSDGQNGGEQLISSRVLVYNFLEETWAIYHPNLGQIGCSTTNNGLSCLGFGFTSFDLKWSSFAVGASPPAGGKNWEDWDETWNSYLNLAGQPALLGGDQNGFVYELNVTQTDNGNPIIPTILTKRFNPFLPGEKGRFGYLDIYYQVAPEVILTINIYANNSSAATLTRTMTLTGSANNALAWQRLYLNGLIGEFIQIEIQDNGISNFRILGMIIHASPAGRLTPGGFL